MLSPDRSGRSIGWVRSEPSPIASSCSISHRTDPEASEAACGELIERHGSMALNLCTRLLGDTQDAEDAFQATFLVLVRKAASIRNPDAAGELAFRHRIASGLPRPVVTPRCSRRPLRRSDRALPGAIRECWQP